MKQQACVLVILDGWGIGKGDAGDAVALANTPNFDSIYSNNPHNTLITFGESVGLPNGQMGNSEVGHINIGAGRIVHQEFQRINVAVANGELHSNSEILDVLRNSKRSTNRLHIIGLFSDGGVHSHSNHGIVMLKMAQEYGIESVFVHAITDGRDCAPQSAIEHIADLEQAVSKLPNVEIATVCGRYYAMDRDKRWARTRLAYDAITKAKGEHSSNLIETISHRYETGEFDEFLKPIIHSKVNNGSIQAGDSVICFNFRTDRLRQLVLALHEGDLSSEGLAPIPNLNMLTFTRYNAEYTKTKVAFYPQSMENGLGEWLSKHEKKQLRLAETEKYPHVTFFMNGGIESAYSDEDRKMAKSPLVATYDLKPEMSAFEVTEYTVSGIESEHYDFVCVNLANADMVGHTGFIDAAKLAVESVDACLGRIYTAAKTHGYSVIIIADHGNAEQMLDEHGNPHTAHTTNLVPIIVSAPNVSIVKAGKLGDIAPTILHILGVTPPPQMTGICLI